MKNVIDIIQSALSLKGVQGFLSDLLNHIVLDNNTTTVCMCRCCPVSC